MLMMALMLPGVVLRRYTVIVALMGVAVLGQRGAAQVQPAVHCPEDKYPAVQECTSFGCTYTVDCKACSTCSPGQSCLHPVEPPLFPAGCEAGATLTTREQAFVN